MGNQIFHRFIDEVEVKRCGKCFGWLPLNSFGRSKQTPDGLRGYCNACRQKRERQWRENNPQESAERSRRYRERNPNRYRESCDKYYSRERKDRIAAARAWGLENSDRYKEIKRAASNRRRARKVNNGVVYYEVKEICERDGWVCQICGEPVEDSDWHIDHFIPICKGGPDTPRNVRFTHAECNQRKSSRLPTKKEIKLWTTKMDSAYGAAGGD